MYNHAGLSGRLACSVHWRAAWVHVPFVIVAVATVLFMGWSTLRLWQAPDDGLIWSVRFANIDTGDPEGPAARAGVQNGDRIVAINGVPLAQRPWLYSQRPGERVVYTIERAGARLSIGVVLAEPSAYVRFVRLEPLLIGMVGWIVGTLVWTLRPFDPVVRLFFAISQLAAVMLAAGRLVATARIGWASDCNSLLQLAVVPVLLHFFTLFPARMPNPLRRTFVLPAYIGSLLLALLTLATWLGVGVAHEPDVLSKARLFYCVAVALLALLVLLRHHPGDNLRSRQLRRLLAFSTVLSAFPLLIGSLLPQVLNGAPLISYTWTYGCWGLLPVSYAYAVYQGELGKVDWFISRSLVYAMLTTLVLGAYALLFFSLNRLAPQSFWLHSALSTAMAVACAALLHPVRHWLQRHVDHWFYGGWYDYRSVVQAASVQLCRANDIERLVDRVTYLTRSMRFEAMALLWPRESTFVVVGGYGWPSDKLMAWRLPIVGSVANHLLATPGIVAQQQLSQRCGGMQLTPDERALLDTPSIQLWMPLLSRGVLYGVLVLGQRQGDVLVDAEDQTILDALAGQTAVVVENVVLLDALKARLVQVEQMRDELVEVRGRLVERREAEQCHMARELHDGPMQDVYGVQFHLNGLEAEMTSAAARNRLAEAQALLHHITQTLRTICGELRPPTLAPFGLEKAIRSHAERFQELHPQLDIQTNLMADEQTLPEQVRMSLFRIYQAALSNIVRHAQARWVFIQLTFDDTQVELEIRDDGRGFVVPARWVTLGRQGHFGLLGSVERAEALGGHLTVTSAPEAGTALQVRVPYNAAPPAETTSSCVGVDERLC